MSIWNDEANQIFLDAIEIASVVAQQDFLDQSCRGDESLRSAVERLLRAHRSAGTFLECPVAVVSDAVPPTGEERPGDRIGPYELVEIIGEGGFGIVFLAQQDQPLRRRVALKIVKPGMDSKQVIARFEAERQVLAIMEHPHIARVLDAGTTPSGRPFFVMDLVRGVPITDYCDQHGLQLRERLELFNHVCGAVQHAHQKGIIHRDLKPGNILVEVRDGTPVPTVIDFGVSKAIGEPLTTATIQTVCTQMVGTPLYMSPEQVVAGNSDVDTRTDVYSLGVILYELLCGVSPYHEHTRLSGFDELRRIVREGEPRRPSVRIRTLDVATATTISRHRGLSHHRRLEVELRGELDWVVMKALEKDRERRYASASALAEDVRRFLTDEPVQACPPSASYRLGKLLRRHTRILATAIVVVLALMAGTTVAVWQAIRADRERVRANRIASRLLVEARRAEEKSNLAEQQQIRAEQAEREQRQQREKAEDLLYASSIRLASQHQLVGDDEPALRMLEACRPQPGHIDRRGLEWWILSQRFQTARTDLMQLPGDVSCTRISPDGRYVAAATDGGQIKRCELGTQQSLPSWETNLDDVRRIEFSPDGRFLAAISYEAALVVLRTSDGTTHLRREKPPTSTKNPDVAFVEEYLLSSGEGKLISIWDLNRQSLKQTWDTDCSDVLDLATSPGRTGVTLLIKHDQPPFYRVRLVGSMQDLARDDQWGIGYPSNTCALSADGKAVAVGGILGEIEVFHIGRPFERVRYWHLSEKVNELHFSPDGKSLVAAERTGVVHVWRSPTPISVPNASSSEAYEHWMAHARPARSAVFAPDSQGIISAGFDGRIVQWNSTYRMIRQVPAPKGCSAHVILSAQNILAMVRKRTVQFVDLRTGKLTGEHTFPEEASDVSVVAANDTGDLLAVYCDSGRSYCATVDQRVTIRELPTAITSQKDGPSLFAFVPGTRTLISGDFTPNLRVQAWDADHRRQVFRHDFSAIAPRKAAILPEYRLLVLTDSELLRINLASGQIEGRTPFSGVNANDLAVASDGQMAAIGSHDRLIELVDSATGLVIHSLRGHFGAPNELTFSRDGRTLLSIDGRGHLRFWHVATGTELFGWTTGIPIEEFHLTSDNRWLSVHRGDTIELYENHLSGESP